MATERGRKVGKTARFSGQTPGDAVMAIINASRQKADSFFVPRAVQTEIQGFRSITR
jgi:hypothetical protein